MTIRYSPPARLPGKGERYYSRTYDPATGKRSWASCETDNLKAAREWVRSREVEEAMGATRRAAQEAAGKTFGDALDAFLEEKRGKIGAVAFGALRARAEAFWRPTFGLRPLRDIVYEDITRYVHARRHGLIRRPLPPAEKIEPGERKRRAPRPPPPPRRVIQTATANDDLRGIASVFNYTIRRGWLDRSPTIGVQRFSGEMRRRVRSLSTVEEDRLLAGCRDGGEIIVTAKRNAGGRAGGRTGAERSWRQVIPSPDYLFPAILVAMRCGFRRRTLLGIRWEHLDIDSATWTVPGELMKVPEDYCAPVPRAVVDELRAWRGRLLAKHGPERVAPSATIFGLKAAASIRRSFRSAARRAGLPKVTLHDLRRNYLNALRRAGVGLEAAMALTAHRSVQTVMKHYREVSEEEKRAAVAALERSRHPGDVAASTALTPEAAESGK